MKHVNNIIVAKFGSELVTSGDGVDQDKINSYAEGLITTYRPSQLIIVSSGAVNAGRARVTQLNNDLSIITLSQLGAASIVSAWESAFARFDVLSGGLLVTHNELQNLHEGPQFMRALDLALQNNVISIINENDALSDTELMKLAVGGDNDGLAAHIATSLPAAKLLLFTKRGGIVDESGQLIPIIDAHNTTETEAMLNCRSLKESTDSVGRGGMISKFQAARRAAVGGVETLIAEPSADMRGKNITRFVIG